MRILVMSAVAFAVCFVSYMVAFVAGKYFTEASLLCMFWGGVVYSAVTPLILARLK